MWAEMICISDWSTRTTEKLHLLNCSVCAHFLGHGSTNIGSAGGKLTGLVSMTLRAPWWERYSSCLRSTWLWKRGCFLTGSSGPNCGETTLSTGRQDSEKTKGLNIDLAGRRKETERPSAAPCVQTWGRNVCRGKLHRAATEITTSSSGQISASHTFIEESNSHILDKHGEKRHRPPP